MATTTNKKRTLTPAKGVGFKQPKSPTNNPSKKSTPSVTRSELSAFEKFFAKIPEEGNK